MSDITADIHCHPSMKPYAGSCNGGLHRTGKRRLPGIAAHLPRTGWRKILGYLTGFTRFTQTDAVSLTRGGVHIVFAAIYPMEKEFSRAKPQSGRNRLVEWLFHLPTGLGPQKIRDIRNVQKGYFSDAEQEYRFLESLHGSRHTCDGKQVTCRLMQGTDKIKINSAADDRFTINMFITIEGAHALYSNFTDIGLDTPQVRADVFGNIEKIKRWKYAPVFMTLAHHFWNGLSGHAESIPGFFEKYRLVNQQSHIHEGLNDFGREVIRRLLDENKKRILIDIKHMSYDARQEYFHMLETEYAGEHIPVIVSHGAVRGSTHNAALFCDKSINFSDEELVKIAGSGGLFGVQLDKSRIASGRETGKFRKCFTRKRVLQHAALLVWRQMQHIAEVLDAAGEHAWDIQCLGSDYDGIVNPVNGVWTAADYQKLRVHLLFYAKAYANSRAFGNLKQDYNRQITAKEMIDRFMGENVFHFVRTTEMQPDALAVCP